MIFWDDPLFWGRLSVFVACLVLFVSIAKIFSDWLQNRELRNSALLRFKLVRVPYGRLRCLAVTNMGPNAAKACSLKVLHGAHLFPKKRLPQCETFDLAPNQTIEVPFIDHNHQRKRIVEYNIDLLEIEIAFEDGNGRSTAPFAYQIHDYGI